jgi:hypothetical protein
MTRLTIVLAVCASGAAAGDWSGEVEVLHELKPCVTYRAKLDGDLVVVRATLQPGWHTFAMDNERRAAEKLAGKPSLGIDQPTQITVIGAVEVAGPWYQSPPKDFSKPQLRWFSWGFEQEATFAARVRRSGSGGAQLGIRGQACTETTCKNIDVSVSVPAPDGNDKTISSELKTLVEVR